MDMRGISSLVINGDQVSIGFNPAGHNGMSWTYTLVSRSGSFETKQVLKLIDSNGRKAWIEITQTWVKLSNHDGVFVFRITYDQVLKGS